MLSFTLLKKGKTIGEIAIERTLTAATIEGHLAYFVGIGEIEINTLVTKEKQQYIKDAATIHGQQQHKVIIENILAGISYGEVKFVLAHINMLTAIK